jgi:hypothetical protein
MFSDFEASWFSCQPIRASIGRGHWTCNFGQHQEHILNDLYMSDLSYIGNVIYVSWYVFHWLTYE